MRGATAEPGVGRTVRVPCACVAIDGVGPAAVVVCQGVQARRASRRTSWVACARMAAIMAAPVDSAVLLAPEASASLDGACCKATAVGLRVLVRGDLGHEDDETASISMVSTTLSSLDEADMGRSGIEDESEEGRQLGPRGDFRARLLVGGGGASTLAVARQAKLERTASFSLGRRTGEEGTFASLSATPSSARCSLLRPFRQPLFPLRGEVSLLARPHQRVGLVRRQLPRQLRHHRLGRLGLQASRLLVRGLLRSGAASLKAAPQHGLGGRVR